MSMPHDQKQSAELLELRACITTPGSADRVQALRHELVSLLCQTEPPTELLVRWLQGLDFPIGRGGEEPFLWLIRALPTGGANVYARARLARMVAQILAAEPDRVRLGDRPERLLYNLFFLASSLSRPQELAEPLDALLRRNFSEPGDAAAGPATLTCSSILRSDFEGSSLLGALRAALIENQIDTRLRGVWRAMLRADGSATLPGTPQMGFEGMMRMPESPATLGRPFVDAIGEALTLMAEKLAGRPSRRRNFFNLACRTLAYYGHPSSLRRELIFAAHANGLEAWAVDSLPSLFEELEPAPGIGHHHLVWHYLASCLPSDSYEMRAQICNDHVFEISISPAARDALTKIASVFEAARLQNPYSSDQAAHGVALQALLESKAVLESLDRSAGGFDRAHRELLQQAGLNRAAADVVSGQAREAPPLGRSPVVEEATSLSDSIKKVATTVEPEPDRESTLARLLEFASTTIGREPTKRAIGQLAKDNETTDWVSDAAHTALAA